ncbi:MAG TPA: copper resistance CopC family protein [Planococcus sp. (in: firmicutes)]|nr:copper resistance CopC family protein [Planococcus sp. (in: firmicutes)]
MKKLIVAALLVLLVMPFTAHAHTALTSSNPAQGEVLAENPEELELVFGTIIEEGSTMTLKGPEADVALDNISISENVMKASITEALVNGQYIISWKIIGEDGHPIEGEILFSSDTAPTEEAVSEEVPEEAAEEPAPEEQPVESSSEQQAAADEGTGDGGVLTILLLIAFAVLVGFGAMLLIKRKR